LGDSLSDISDGEQEEEKLPMRLPTVKERFFPDSQVFTINDIFKMIRGYWSAPVAAATTTSKLQPLVLSESMVSDGIYWLSQGAVIEVPAPSKPVNNTDTAAASSIGCQLRGAAASQLILRFDDLQRLWWWIEVDLPFYSKLCIPNACMPRLKARGRVNEKAGGPMDFEATVIVYTVKGGTSTIRVNITGRVGSMNDPVISQSPQFVPPPVSPMPKKATPASSQWACHRCGQPPLPHSGSSVGIAYTYYFSAPIDLVNTSVQ
jgi:hypothetical protein